LRVLIESSFARKLIPDYFERTPLWRAYVSENYRAAVIMTHESFPDGSRVAYLDKFAVADEAQGEGLGRAVWQPMRAENPALFWRARHGNAVNDFYFAECEGCCKDERWTAFWCGVGTFAAIEACVEHCHARPATLKN